MIKGKRVIALLSALCMLVGLWGTAGTVKAEESGAMNVVVDGVADDWHYIEPLYMGGGVVSKVSA